MRSAKPQKPKLTFSWNETTFSYSIQKIWTGDSAVENHSGTYSNTYETYTQVYNSSDNVMIYGDHVIEHTANYTWISNTTIIGNITIDMNLQVYRVNIDYGSNIKVIWIALKQGIMEMDHYFVSYIDNFSYYEEYHQDIASLYTSYDHFTKELVDSWATADEIDGDKHYTHIENRTRFPYYLHSYRYMEFTTPLILTFQLFTTENKDRIAWVNMIQNFIIYGDLDSNGIYSVVDENSGERPGLFSCKEKVGSLDPSAYHGYGTYIEYIDDSGETFSAGGQYPIDKTVSEIASAIIFTPPTSNSDTNVHWSIQYPNYPTITKFWDGENYFSNTGNKTFSQTCPTDYSYEYDYNVGSNYTNLDTTWEIGKITNASLYNVVQGYGLNMPQYNFFLSTFNIDEIETKELTLPCDLFSFESNDTLVAQINMGGPNKENYTLYDFPSSSIDTDFTSKGGSINPIVMVSDQLASHYETPFVNSIYSLIDIVKQDPTFNIADSLFRMETQNYPVWSGEKLRHDPTLTVYYGEYEKEAKGGFIPGYNHILLLGTTGVMTLVVLLKKRKKIFK